MLQQAAGATFDNNGNIPVAIVATNRPTDLFNGNAGQLPTWQKLAGRALATFQFFVRNRFAERFLR